MSQVFQNIAQFKRFCIDLNLFKNVFRGVQCHSKLGNGCFTILFDGAYFLLALMVEGDESSWLRMANYPVVLAGYRPSLTALLWLKTVNQWQTSIPCRTQKQLPQLLHNNMESVIIGSSGIIIMCLTCVYCAITVGKYCYTGFTYKCYSYYKILPTKNITKSYNPIIASKSWRVTQHMTEQSTFLPRQIKTTSTLEHFKF